jgi:hypothetical protein
VLTPKAGGRPSRTVLTQVGRALEQLGIELIPAGSPQASSRCERSYRTFQGRLPQELRAEGLSSLEAANHFLEQTYLVQHNSNFTVAPAQKGSAFVPYAGSELDKIFSRQLERIVANDNTVTIGKLRLQVDSRSSALAWPSAACWSANFWSGPSVCGTGRHLLGRYDRDGQLLERQSGPQHENNRELA